MSKRYSRAGSGKTQDFKFAGVLTFSPSGVLFVGDTVSGKIFAYEIGGSISASDSPLEVKEIDEKAGQILGVLAKKISFNGLAVHPQTREVYLSVSRSHGSNFVPAILKVDGNGKISNLNLTGFKSSSFELPNLPDRTQQFRSRAGDWIIPDATEYEKKASTPMRTLSIMDMVFHNGELLVSGISNEEFSSTLRRIPFPFKEKASSSRIEIYHIAHGRYEIRAPIRAMRVA